MSTPALRSSGVFLGCRRAVFIDTSQERNGLLSWKRMSQGMAAPSTRWHRRRTNWQVPICARHSLRGCGVPGTSRAPAGHPPVAGCPAGSVKERTGISPWLSEAVVGPAREDREHNASMPKRFSRDRRDAGVHDRIEVRVAAGSTNESVHFDMLRPPNSTRALLAPVKPQFANCAFGNMPNRQKSAISNAAGLLRHFSRSCTPSKHWISAV
jgi:hypothetical protein